MFVDRAVRFEHKFAGASIRENIERRLENGQNKEKTDHSIRINRIDIGGINGVRADNMHAKGAFGSAGSAMCLR